MDLIRGINRANIESKWVKVDTVGSPFIFPNVWFYAEIPASTRLRKLNKAPADNSCSQREYVFFFLYTCIHVGQ